MQTDSGGKDGVNESEVAECLCILRDLITRLSWQGLHTQTGQQRNRHGQSKGGRISIQFMCHAAAYAPAMACMPQAC